MSFNTITKSVTMDELLAGTFPMKKRAVTLSVSATPYQRGMLIGVTTADINVAKLVSDQSSDGTEVVEGILLEEYVDASTETKQATIALTGDFNQAALTVGGTSEVADYQAEARAKSIFIDETADPVV